MIARACRRLSLTSLLMVGAAASAAPWLSCGRIRENSLSAGCVGRPRSRWRAAGGLAKVTALALATVAASAPTTSAADWNTVSYVPLEVVVARTPVVWGPCPGIESTRRSCHIAGTIYMDRRSVAYGEILGHVYYHELGHAFDYWLLTDADRALLERFMGERRAWRSPPNSPHEKFAEAFKLCALFGARVTRRHLAGVAAAGFGWRPTVARQRRVCRAIISISVARAHSAGA